MRTWGRLLPWPALEEWGEVTYVGDGHIYLPGRIHKLVWLVDKTNKESINPSDGTWDRNYTVALSENTQGSAKDWEDRGIFPTITTVSGPVAAFSTDASDVVGIFLEGDITPSISSYSLEACYNKYRQVVEISVGGQTPVTSDEVFTQIYSAGKTVDSDGAIILQCGGSTVGIIGPLEDQATYRKIKLLRRPTAGTVFMYKGFCDPEKLVNTSQIIPHPVNFDFIKWHASAEVLWDLRETERALVAEKKAGQIAEQHIKKEDMFGAGGGRIEPEDLT